jgi:uncharacterized OsmC-like protein
MSDERTYHTTLRLARDYQFVAEFPDLSTTPAPLVLDEPAPLGGDRGPNAAALLGAAIGDCLAASLAFCLHKSRVNMDHLEAEVVTHVGRNERGNLRITGVDVELRPEVDEADTPRLERCERLFEDFCIVTESVRHGIPVNIHVADAEHVLA